MLRCGKFSDGQKVDFFVMNFLMSLLFILFHIRMDVILLEIFDETCTEMINFML